MVAIIIKDKETRIKSCFAASPVSSNGRSPLCAKSTFAVSDNSNSAPVCLLNSLWRRDAKCRHKSGSTLAQVIAWHLTVPRHYLNQCWLNVSKAHWHSSAGNFTRDTRPSITEISLKFPSPHFIHISQGTTATVKCQQTSIISQLLHMSGESGTLSPYSSRQRKKW